MSNTLPVEKLRRVADPKFIDCDTTQGLVPLKEIIGQERAVRALKFGLGIKDRGFNIYVAGSPGTGRTTAVTNFLEDVAKKDPVPHDWCYVNNFLNEYEPRAMKLPPGKGKAFQRDMKAFVDDARTALSKAFESEAYAERRESTIKGVEEKRQELMEEVNTEAKKKGFVIQMTRVGLLLIPVVNGKPVTDEEMAALPPKSREEILARREQLEVELRSAMKRFLDIDRRIGEETEKLDSDVALYAIGHLVADLTEKYKDVGDVAAYLGDVQDDMLANLDQFVKGSDEQQQQTPFPMPYPVRWPKASPFKKYEVNVMVDNSNTTGAPVVMETNPTYQNLLGRVEKEAQFGALVTDFTMIRGGALHKANGGYLMVPVEELLRSDFAYDGLKRSLKHEHVEIEEIEERLGYAATKSLRPEPIPLKVKVVLIGDPNLYQQLFTLDMEFEEFFKVKADFDTTMLRNDENMRQYAAFVCTLCQKENLKHLDGTGLAKLLEHSSRLADDQQKLSTRFADVADVVREANYYAAQDKSELITGDHVKKAIEEKVYRSKLVQEKVQEMIKRGILLIDTDAEGVGQVNGLSVISLGDFSFGTPSRVTASVALGREGVMDIEREAKMGGPIHTKGVLILSGYLHAKYAQDKPLSLSARIVLEQNYGGVEGDSASSTELYAMLSALSGLPVKQSIAVTGSVNQKGEVQAIGGVNEKIEGFYEVCKAKGFNGKQGVMIPASNVQNLMLKEEVVEAVRAGKFRIYTAGTIDEGIEVLTGVKAGQRQKGGGFAKGTVNERVDTRLREMAKGLKELPPSSARARRNRED